MTNFEYIKSMDINELAEFLDCFDWEDIRNLFGKEFCEKCELIDAEEINGHYTEYAYCEIKGHKCRFVEDGTITQEEYDNPIKWWFCKENVNNSDNTLTIQND